MKELHSIVKDPTRWSKHKVARTNSTKPLMEDEMEEADSPTPTDEEANGYRYAKPSNKEHCERG